MYLLRSQIVRTVNMSCTPAWSDRVHSVGLGERVQIAVIFLYKTLIIRTRNTQRDGRNHEIYSCTLPACFNIVNCRSAVALHVYFFLQ